MVRSPGSVPFAAETRLLVQTALLIFIYTVSVGILNGTDLVDFERGPLLAHLHGGTIGWITLSALAAGLRLYAPERASEGERSVVRWLTYLAMGAAAAYVAAFFATTGPLRPLFGTLTMLAITGFALWILGRARVTTLSVPHLGILAAVVSAMIGAIFGVLLGLKIAFNIQALPVAIGEAHPAMMVVGFLYPVGMALIEWALDPASVTRRATLAGRLQIALPFIGGLVLATSILLGLTALAPLSLLGQIGGLAIMPVRLFPALMRVRLFDRSTARHALVASIFLPINLVLLVYLIANYIENIPAAPRPLLLSLDHTIFVGVMTNGILAFAALLWERERPAWIDHVIFWGVTIGISGFVVGLLLDEVLLKRTFTPILGATLLLAIAVHTMGLRANDANAR